MNNDLNSNFAMELFSEILAQENILLSVNSGSGICEARIEKGLPFRIREKWATIGDESRPWHIHLNMEEAQGSKVYKKKLDPMGERVIVLDLLIQKEILL